MSEEIELGLEESFAVRRFQEQAKHLSREEAISDLVKLYEIHLRRKKEAKIELEKLHYQMMSYQSYAQQTVKQTLGVNLADPGF